MAVLLLLLLLLLPAVCWQVELDTVGKPWNIQWNSHHINNANTINFGYGEMVTENRRRKKKKARRKKKKEEETKK